LGSEVPLAILARSLLPFLTVEALVVGLTLSYPGAVHLLETPGARSRHPVGPALSKEELEEKLLQMLRPPPLPNLQR